MENSTATFPILEASTNSTSESMTPMDWLEVGVYSINLFFSFPIHCYIIWLIVTGSGIASEFFNLNLCVCEIGICINSLVFIMSFWIPSFEVLDWFLQGLTFSGRPLFQCLMCVERYLAVVHPVTFLKYKPLRYRLVCCIPVWIFCFGSCFFYLHVISLKEDTEHARFSSVKLSLIIFIQLFCLGAVLRALKQSGPGDRKKEEENQMKRRAFNLILITTVSMTVLYFPFAITALLIVFTEESSPRIWFTGLTCFILAGFVHPFLYLRRAGKLPCCC